MISNAASCFLDQRWRLVAAAGGGWRAAGGGWRAAAGGRIKCIVLSSHENGA